MSKMSLPTQMAIGMVLGVIVGALAPTLGIEPTWLKPLGDIFITLIRMIVVPLVFATLVAGAASVGDISKLGRVATKTLIYYIATTGFAVAVGLLLANIVQPGQGLDLASTDVAIKEINPPSLLKVLMDVIPLNPVEAMSKGNMLQIIFFAMLLGFSLSSMGERAKPVTQLFDIMGECMIKLTGFVMLYAPIGVFGLIAFTVSNHGLAVLLPLLKLVGVMYVASLCHTLIVYVPLLKFSGISIKHFFAVMLEPILVAFSTCSSAAALSTNLVSVRRLGASRTVSSFSIPLGNTINMDGSAIYMGIAAIFAAAIYGVDLPLSSQLSIILLGMLASIGCMGVPGAALVMMTMVFTQVGIPLEAIALVAGVDRVMDMARTTINVIGDATGAIVVSKLEGELGSGEEA